MDLNKPSTQKAFGEMVGISQQAVAELMARGVLSRGQPARAWLLAYMSRLREAAAERGADGMLAMNRAAESASRNELLKIKLKRARVNYADKLVIDRVIAFVGGQIASQLEPLPERIRMLCPQLHEDDWKGIENAILEARILAAGSSLATLEDANQGDDTDDVVTAA